jgi:hypothetical protein
VYLKVFEMLATSRMHRIYALSMYVLLFTLLDDGKFPRKAGTTVTPFPLPYETLLRAPIPDAIFLFYYYWYS